jgi:predicted metal-dependent phosphoesterase TrpH
MLIDLHTHSRPYSGDSALDAEELAERAADAGLDGIVLTEHDALHPTDEVRILSERAGILVLRGMEITTDIGHVLAFGLSTYAPALRSIEVLRREAEECGAIIFLAHPYRGWNRPIDWERLPELVHGVEALNGQEHATRNDRAQTLATRFSVPGIGGSDTHFLPGLAVCATRLTRRPADEADLAALLYTGLHEAVQLRVPAWSRMEYPTHEQAT